MPDPLRHNTPRSRLLHGDGDVRCACGALMFRACGAVHLEVKCRRCRTLWRISSI